MAVIQNLERLVSKLRAKATQANKDANASVVVGFTQSYGIYVHENLEAVHPVGQAKFLEQPFREMRNVLYRIVSEAVRHGKTMAQGLLLAGLRLQREAQKLCPVDTGALKGSAFTRVER